MAVSFVFLVMGKKGYEVLNWYFSNHDKKNIYSVVSEKDTGVLDDYYDEIKLLCESQDTNFMSRKSFIFKQGYYLFAIGWRWLLPPGRHTIILHDGLLPRYKGFAPIVNALINNEPEIGATALFAGSEYDSGDIIAQKKTNITYPIKIQYAIEIIALLYIECLIEIIPVLLKNEELESFPQDFTKATYSLWRDNEDYRIDWNWSSTKIKCAVDALGFPYKGAFTFLGNKKIILEEVKELEDIKVENRDIGKVIFNQDMNPAIVCGNGLILITKAYFEWNGKSIFPLQKFRSRFK